MKITRKQLRQIIKEETRRLNEENLPVESESNSSPLPPDSPFKPSAPGEWSDIHKDIHRKWLPVMRNQYPAGYDSFILSAWSIFSTAADLLGLVQGEESELNDALESIIYEAQSIKSKL